MRRLVLLALALCLFSSMFLLSCSLYKEEKCFDVHIKGAGSSTDSFCRDKGFDVAIGTKTDANSYIYEICCKKDGLI